jgi:hypothetical protein
MGGSHKYCHTVIIPLGPRRTGGVSRDDHCGMGRGTAGWDVYMRLLHRQIGVFSASLFV